MDLRDFQKLCERLNPYCRHALEAAVYFCRERTHYEVTPEHFLLKLLDDPGCDLSLAARAGGIDTGEWATAVTNALDRLSAGNTGGAHWTQDVIRLLERAWILGSVHYGFPHIRSGSILLALSAEGEISGGSIGAAGMGGALPPKVMEALRKMELRDKLAELVAGSSEGAFEAATAATPAASTKAGKGSGVLERFTVNLNQLAKEGKLDRAIGRDREVRSVVDVLCRRRKNNVVLVGEPGVGKTAIVEGLALRVVEGDVPEPLLDNDILSLDLGQLQAGAGIKGEFENRLKQIIEGVAAHPRPTVLFIDEAHLLIGAGAQPGGSDAANLLKPALARGQLRTIAATTWAEYKKYFEKDAALQDRFEVVKIDEPDESLAVTMLRGAKPAYEKFHGVDILDEGIVAAVRLSDRYLTGRQLPRKAVDLLDTAAARVRIGLSAKPSVIEQLERRIENLRIERTAKQRDHDGQLADYTARLTDIDRLIQECDRDLEEWRKRWAQEKEMAEEYQGLRKRLAEGNGDPSASPRREDIKKALDRLREVQGRNPLVAIHLDSAIAANVIADWTGIPVGSMVEEEMPKLLELETRLRERVRGQDHALRVLAETLRVHKAGLGNPAAPIGVFLLVGPSGTGKTETALALADVMFGGERFCTAINMSEFKEEHTVSLLIGSPPGYVGYGEGGVLTEAVRQRPYSVVLLDEIEKAHPRVLELFYQVFDKGYCEDRTGRVINFRNTIILMTSNLESSTITEMCATEPRPEPGVVLETIQPALVDYFKPALLARFRVIPYYPLGPSILRDIVEIKLGRIRNRLRDVHGVEMEYSTAVADGLASRCGHEELGARQLDHVIHTEVLTELSSGLLARMRGSSPPSRVSVDLDESGRFQCSLE